MSSDTAPIKEPSEKNDTKTGDLEWAYSGKAMRGQCILYWLVSLVLFAAAIYVTVAVNKYYLAAWASFVVLAAALWIHFYCVYFYRTWTIRYKLTDQRLYSYQGLFTKTQDTMEIVFIEDLQYTQTLWDRLLNGGVGTIKVYSGKDKTNPKPSEDKLSVLVISGVDDAKTIFEHLDRIRSELRKNKAMLAQ